MTWRGAIILEGVLGLPRGRLVAAKEAAEREGRTLLAVRCPVTLELVGLFRL